MKIVLIIVGVSVVIALITQTPQVLLVGAVLLGILLVGAALGR